jgi:antitoxin (DNA-binding transcriptional repressor) of toxin-antitoxin stability system
MSATEKPATTTCPACAGAMSADQMGLPLQEAHRTHGAPVADVTPASRTPDGSTYSLNYVWPRKRVILHVSKELTPQSCRDLASSLLWFAERADAAKPDAPEEGA